MKTILHSKYFPLLAVYIFILFIIVIVEFIEQTGLISLGFHWSFWDALVSFGTIGTVVVALIVPSIEKQQQEENKANLLISNIKNELAVNFDQLCYNSLNGRDFMLETTHLDRLLANANFVNIGASDGVFRNLRIFYTSAKWFNVRMKEFVDSYNTWITLDTVLPMHQMWWEIKIDVIKHMLLILWIGEQLNFETEGETSMQAINKFMNSSEDLVTRAKLLTESLNKSWKSWNLPANLPNDKDITSNAVTPEDPHLNFLIIKLFNIYKGREVKVLGNIDSALRKLIKSPNNT